MAETVTMPKLGFDMAEGTLVRWVIQEGEAVSKGKVLAEIETDKATVEVESNFDGILARQLVKAGDIVPVNMPIAIIAAPGEQIESQPSSTPAAPASTVSASPASQPAAIEAPVASVEMAESQGGVKASPLARRMARDFKLNLASISGSGPGGRIIKKDIEAFLAAPAVSKPAAPQVSPPAAPAPTGAFSQPPTPLEPIADQILPLNRLRAAIGRRMVEAKQQVPHFYVTHEYDMETVMELRKQINSLLLEDEKLSVNDFVIKAVALTLRQFPNLNASLQDGQIIQHGSVNIGVAVAVEGGLLTIVNRDTDRKPIRQISAEVRTMVGRARDGKVRPDDIEGSTFSISNLGMFEVEHFIAIINPPEAAILAVGSVRDIPVIKNGLVTSGLRMKATISVDHRISDGVEAARFLQSLAQYLQEPLRLLI